MDRSANVAPNDNQNRKGRFLRLLILLTLVLFTVISGFGCYDIHIQYWMTGSSSNSTADNGFWLMLVLSAMQGMLLFRRKGRHRILSAVLALVAFAATVSAKAVMEATYSLFSDTSAYIRITWLGGLAFWLSAVILLLQIIRLLTKMKITFEE